MFGSRGICCGCPKTNDLSKLTLDVQRMGASELSAPQVRTLPMRATPVTVQDGLCVTWRRAESCVSKSDDSRWIEPSKNNATHSPAFTRSSYDDTCSATTKEVTHSVAHSKSGLDSVSPCRVSRLSVGRICRFSLTYWARRALRFSSRSGLRSPTLSSRQQLDVTE